MDLRATGILPFFVWREIQETDKMDLETTEIDKSGNETETGGHRPAPAA